MRQIIFPGLFLLLLAAPLNAQQASYPLHIGDRWQYLEDLSYTYQTTIERDTMMPNGHRYAATPWFWYQRQEGDTVYYYPNPFNPTTTIRYALPHRSHVTLTVFNTLGQQVATLVDREVEAGYNEVQLDAAGLASGVNFYRLLVGDFVQTKKLCIVR
jgi:hypothetical protein